jgi:hypothetical protein
MDTLAPPVLAVRRRSTLERLVLDPELELGAGGEAVVYEVPGDAGLVAKVYHEPTIERARKLTLMLANPPAMPAGTSIAWPVDLLLDGHGFAGFLMPRAGEPRLFEFYNPVTRRATAPAFHAGLLHRAGRNLAAAFHALHTAGYVVGDVNESNLLVSPGDAAVTLVDADSLQVRDAAAGVTFRSRVGKPEFTPPELQGVAFGEVDRAPEHDRFGLAVLLFLLLMEGTHPFAARLEEGQDALPVEDRIRGGLFPHAGSAQGCRPPRLSPRFDALHPQVRALFVRAFVDGHADPAARPSPAEWRDELAAAEAELAACDANGLHRYGAHLAACPWCERTALLGGRDPFPAEGATAPPAARPPRPRRQRPRMAVPAPMVPAPLSVYLPPKRLQGMGIDHPLPAVFGRHGLTNPLVTLFPALAVTVQTGGSLHVGAMIVMLLSAFHLVTGHWRNVRVSTVVLAVCATLFVASVVGLGVGSSAQMDDGDAPVMMRPLAGAGGEADPADGVGDAEGTVRPFDAASGQDAAAARLPDLYSTPVGEAPVAPAPPPVVTLWGPTYPADQVDQLPRLWNDVDAARTLASLYRVRAASPRADTVRVWLRVTVNGRVSAGGVQLIDATSGPAGEAAVRLDPYLGFIPALRDGRPVSVWVVQRMVIVP